jgi:hypothetical protein
MELMQILQVIKQTRHKILQTLMCQVWIKLFSNKLQLGTHKIVHYHHLKLNKMALR